MTRNSPLRILGAVLLVLTMSATCVLLGIWQWNRHQQKAANLAQIEAAWDAPVQSLDEVLADGLEVTNEWQRVSLSGEFVQGSSSVLRGRHVAGGPATTALALFLDSSTGQEIGIIVARGWHDVDASPPPLPEGPQELVVRLRTEESSRNGTPVPASVTEMNTRDILQSMGEVVPADAPILQGYVQETEAAAPLADFPDPEQTLGNNLSYAFQWWFFAAAIPVGAVILVRREQSDRLLGTSASAPAPRKVGRAEAEEDALIDAQLGGASTPA